jgi:diguanylate cyclase (GGDEF)-like protein
MTDRPEDPDKAHRTADIIFYRTEAHVNTKPDVTNRTIGYTSSEILSYVVAAVIFLAVFYFTGRVGVTPELFIYRIAVSAATASVFLLIVMLASRAAVRRNILETQELYQKISKINDRMPGGVFRCRSGKDWNITFANQSFYDFIGLSEDEFRKKFSSSFLSLIHRSQYKACITEINNSMAKTGSVSLEIPLTCKDCVKWAIFSAVLSDDKSEIFCSINDISKIKEDNEDLREHKERYDIAMGLTHEIIYEFDVQNGTIHYSANFTGAFGILPDFSNFPECLSDMDMIHKDDLRKVITTYDEMKNGQNYANIDYRAKSHGRYTWYKNSMTAIKNTEGKTLRVVGVLSDIDEEKRTIEQMKESALRDPLTQLYNKTSTKTLIEKYLSGGSRAALFIIDIDNFKDVNDTLGHLYGDAVLSELAHTLNVIFRSGDIAGRIGGDEFLVLMTDTNDNVLAADKAKKIINRFGREAIKDSLEVKISVSIGIADFPQDGTTFNTLMEKADHALYSARKAGKNNFAFYGDID